MTDTTTVAQLSARLVSQWFNVLTAALSLPRDQFQLAQGAVAVGATSESLWAMFDAVPPASINHLYDPDQHNVLSSGYGAVINNLWPQWRDRPDALAAVRARYPLPWSAYLAPTAAHALAAASPPNGGALSRLLAPLVASTAPLAAAQPTAADPVVTAVDRWYAAGGAAGPKAYGGTVETLRAALATAPSVTVTLDTSTETTDVADSWAGGVVAPPPADDVPPALANAAAALAASRVQIRASYAALTLFRAPPLSAPSTVPSLLGMPAWFTPEALALAVARPDATVWKPGAPQWSTMFGPDGSLQRACTALLVADGSDVEMVLTEPAARAVQALLASAGDATPLLPFVGSPSGPAALAPSAADDGTWRVTASSPRGAPFVLGVLVTPIAAAFPVGGG